MSITRKNVDSGKTKIISKIEGDKLRKRQQKTGAWRKFLHTAVLLGDSRMALRFARGWH